jgi:hypothetical protein
MSHFADVAFGANLPAMKLDCAQRRRKAASSKE